MKRLETNSTIKKTQQQQLWKTENRLERNGTYSDGGREGKAKRHICEHLNI